MCGYARAQSIEIVSAFEQRHDPAAAVPCCKFSESTGDPAEIFGFEVQLSKRVVPVRIEPRRYD